MREVLDSALAYASRMEQTRFSLLLDSDGGASEMGRRQFLTTTLGITAGTVTGDFVAGDSKDQQLLVGITAAYPTDGE